MNDASKSSLQVGVQEEFMVKWLSHEGIAVLDQFFPD